MAIDMWSFGCIMAELYTGFPIFPGENELDQLGYIMEICGVPSREVLSLSTRKSLFFDSVGKPIIVPNSRGKERIPNSKQLDQVLKCDQPEFLDFLEKCFKWHPCERLTPLQALKHPWILHGLPENVLDHHMKMFNQPEDPKLIFKLTHSEIQGFPENAQNQSIREIIQEIKQEDLLRDIKRQKAKLNDSKPSISANESKPPRYVDSANKSPIKKDTGVSIATVNLSSTSLQK